VIDVPGGGEGEDKEDGTLTVAVSCMGEEEFFPVIVEIDGDTTLYFQDSDFVMVPPGGRNIFAAGCLASRGA